MDSKKAFGHALRAVRVAKELTQEDFAVVSSRTYLSSLERGMKSPTLEKIRRLTDRLDVHPLTLLTLYYSIKDGSSPKILLSAAQRELDELEVAKR